VATSILDAAEAHRVGLVDVVVPRESFEDQWRAVARKLETLPVGEIERVMNRKRSG
jgi:enoyl-CoA hydratase